MPAISTHCSRPVIEYQFDIPGFPKDAVVLTPTGGIGGNHVRGVVVFMHGINTGVGGSPAVAPFDVYGYLPAYPGTLSSLLVADGWVVVYSPPYPEDGVAGTTPSKAVARSIATDSRAGGTYRDTNSRWWDHVVAYAANLLHPGSPQNFSTQVPLLPIGGSWGAWHALNAARDRTSTIVGYAADHPPTILQNVGLISEFWPLNTSGLDYNSSSLIHVNVPGLITYGTNDAFVGWNRTGTAPGVQPINSTCDEMIAGAQAAGMPVTRNAFTGDAHDFMMILAGTYYPTAGPTSLTSINGSGVLPFYQGAPGGGAPQFASGLTAVLASDGAWHNITWTGSTGTSQFNGVTVASPGSATISAGAPICSIGNGAGVPMSIFYWVKTVIDPLAPLAY